MIKGTVTVLESLSKWYVFGVGDQAAEVCIAGEERYRLVYRYNMEGFMSCPEFVLCDLDGSQLRRWRFQIGMLRTHLDLSEESDFPMSYVVGMFGRRYFKTKEGKIPSYFQIKEQSRTFELDGMHFEHRDYQSKISFRCPPVRLEQTIVMAHLLFQPPLMEQDG
ncbi:hypothetical protein Rhal01_03107 [Rubritalea halochordaticola]|uniref:Uncharacterized protein n=1 Tax=Rubritalea halochordaticola TaxID=714537 RepID=A0ABP9V2L4_9BACT